MNHPVDVDEFSVEMNGNGVRLRLDMGCGATQKPSSTS
jgi:hypothetical protein